MNVEPQIDALRAAERPSPGNVAMVRDVAEDHGLSLTDAEVDRAAALVDEGNTPLRAAQIAAEEANEIPTQPVGTEPIAGETEATSGVPSASDATDALTRQVRDQQAAATTPLAQQATEAGRTAALAQQAAKDALKGMEGAFKKVQDQLADLDAWAAEQQRAHGGAEGEEMSPQAAAFNAELAAANEPIQEAQSFMQAAMAAMNCLIRGGTSGT